MDPLLIARWQFAITTVYHFFFVPLTLGLSVLVAVMQTLWVRTGDETYKRMTKFWGKLFVINFAMGVVTGIVQEFQFGMNWSEYSRFVGDIFGAPLAIEALLAFFLESTFIGMWLFGWEKLSKRVHLAAIWLVAIGSNLSALWILIANSFMQEPAGYVLRNGRAEMVDFGALLANPHVWAQWPHVFFSGLATAGFFMLGITAWRLVNAERPWAGMQKDERRLHKSRRVPPAGGFAPGERESGRAGDAGFNRSSLQVAAVAALIGAVMVGLVGHTQAQHMVRTQPMKMAAAEALWDTAQPASMSLFTIGDMTNRRDVFAIRLPALLSILSCNNTSCAVEGINELQAKYEKQYGPGNYVPFVVMIYWSFRAMVGAGVLMVALAAWALYSAMRDTAARGGPSTAPGKGRSAPLTLRVPSAGKGRPAPRTLRVPSAGSRWLFRLLPLAIFLPYLANSTGWILTEMGRQPWLVFGVLKIQDGVSSSVSGGMVLASTILYTLLYGALMVADVYLLLKYAKADPADVAADVVPSWT